jgi:hypothetical protein
MHPFVGKKIVGKAGIKNDYGVVKWHKQYGGVRT